MNNDLQETIILDNNNEYLILDRIMYNKYFYILLINASDENDILVQKEVLIENEIRLSPLTDENEFNEVMKRFASKTIKP